MLGVSVNSRGPRTRSRKVRLVLITCIPIALLAISLLYVLWPEPDVSVDFYRLGDGFYNGREISLHCYAHPIEPSGWYLLQDFHNTSLSVICHSDISFPDTSSELIITGVSTDYEYAISNGQTVPIECRLFVETLSWRAIGAEWRIQLRRWLLDLPFEFDQ